MSQPQPQSSRIAVLGAGRVGPVIARLALAAGHQVAIATSGPPEDIALIAELIIPGAQPRWASEAVADGGALQQMIAKIEAAAGFLIIDRAGAPLSPTDAGRDFIREAHQILQAAREQMAAIQ